MHILFFKSVENFEIAQKHANFKDVVSLNNIPIFHKIKLSPFQIRILKKYSIFKGLIFQFEYLVYFVNTFSGMCN